MNTEITTAKCNDLKFKLYCRANTERRNYLTERLRKSISENNIKEFILVKQAITEELKNEKAGVSEERFNKLSAKIDKIKDYDKRDYFRLLAEASFLYDSLGDFEGCSEQVEKQLEKERKAK